MAESKSGSFVVNNNTGSFTVNVDADQLTDGQKTMSVQIRTSSTRGPVIGNLSAPITINDTSFTPAGTIISQGCVPGTYTYRITKADGQGGSVNEDTPNSVACGYVAPGNPVYSLTRSVNNANEGSSFNITFNTDQSGSFPYTISGVASADIGGATLSGSVTNGQVLTFNVTADATTEGTETFTISLNNGQANASVTINDTSITPTPGNPTYSITAPTNINEGSLGVFTVNTTNVSNSTLLYWKINHITTERSDFFDASSGLNMDAGSVTINSNTGTFSIKPTIDSTTEGNQTFTVSIRTGSTLGPVVATSNTVTINDTSTTPNPGTRPVITSISPNEHIVYGQQPASATIMGSGFTGVTVLTFTYVAFGSSSIRQFNLTGSDFQILNDSTIVFSTPGIGRANVSSTCNLTVTNSSGESNAVTYRFKADYTLYDLPTSIIRGSTYYVTLRTGFYGGSVLLQWQGGSQSFTLDVNGYTRVGFYATPLQGNFLPYQVTFPDGYSVSGTLRVT